jgi:hypothetical protein
MTSKLTAALKAKFLHGRQTCCVHSGSTRICSANPRRPAAATRP